MIEIYDDTTLAYSLATMADADLALLIGRIAHDAKASGLWSLTAIVVVRGPADLADLEAYLGFDPLVGPFGAAEAGPYWSYLERHQRYFEMLHCVGDTGFASFILIRDVTANPLAALCRRHVPT
jgi:hypothetical protein